jgi:hypothetical protein
MHSLSLYISPNQSHNINLFRPFLIYELPPWTTTRTTTLKNLHKQQTNSYEWSRSNLVSPIHQ